MAGSREAMKAASPLVSIAVEGGPFPDVKAAEVKKRAQKMLAFLKLGDVELSIALVDDSSIRTLNHNYRQKDKATDVLAFPMLDPLVGKPPKARAPSKASAAKSANPSSEPGVWSLDTSPFRELQGMLGDVIISVETARKQAQQNDRPLLSEITMLLAHGLLHLLGFDHRTDAEERAMKIATAELERAAASSKRSSSRMNTRIQNPTKKP